MKEIIGWLITIEDRARRCYEKAANLFCEDKELSRFLTRLAEAEEDHLEIIRDIAERLKDKIQLPFFITLDGETKKKIEDPFTSLERALDGKKLTRQALFEHMVTVEFSEWNDIFLCTINAVKDAPHKYSRVAPKLQQHKRSIERFLESDPSLKGLVERIRGYSSVWRENILVVHNSESIASLFAAVLKDEGGVDVVANGEEALKKLARNYYAAIIACVRMPVMDGIEFYKKAVKLYPQMNERIIFCTDSIDERDSLFFRANNLKCLVHPVPVNELRKAVADVLDRPS